MVSEADFFCLQFEVDSYFTKNFYQKASVFISTSAILLGFGNSSGSDGWKKAVFGQKRLSITIDFDAAHHYELSRVGF